MLTTDTHSPTHPDEGSSSMPKQASPSPAAASESITPFIKIKTIVGDEVQPAFNDAVQIRKEVFCGEQSVSLAEEIDGLDAVAVHLIAYIDLDARKKRQEQQKVLDRLQASSGLVVKYTHPAAHEVSSRKGEPPATYKPPALQPVGTLRIRRVATCSQLGKFNMMLGKIERLCVRKEYRRTGVGEVLLQAAEKTTREALHVPWVMIHAQVHAKSFYLHHGYVVWSEREFLDANIPHIAMVKNLSSTDMNGAAPLSESHVCENVRSGHSSSTATAATAATRLGSRL